MNAIRPPRGFTLLELVVVMTIVALLAGIAAPRYFESVDRARERVLRQNLGVMRDAIDKFHADTGAWPSSLAELVTRRYLRRVPEDPVTGSDATWVVVGPPAGPPAGSPGSMPDARGYAGGGVYDVRSGADGRARDGTAYANW